MADKRLMTGNEACARGAWEAGAASTLYPEENFSGEPHTLEPGEKFKLEDSQLEQVASLKIEYVPLLTVPQPGSHTVSTVAA